MAEPTRLGGGPGAAALAVLVDLCAQGDRRICSLVDRGESVWGRVVVGVRRADADDLKGGVDGGKAFPRPGAFVRRSHSRSVMREREDIGPEVDGVYESPPNATIRVAGHDVPVIAVVVANV